VKTGMRPLRAAATTDSRATKTVTSPLPPECLCPSGDERRCGFKDGRRVSTFASISSSPISLQTLRATVVNASEFDSAEFHASPTDLRPETWLAPSGKPDQREPCFPVRQGASDGPGILATDSDSGTERVCYHAEHMHGPARLICVGDRLH
jgi:hypothetical protein